MIRTLFCLIFIFSKVNSAAAQTADSARFHIAVFLPLYLDSAFDAGGAYRFDQNFPKYLNPGLEFYEGLRLAMDSLRKTHSLVELTVYDTRSSAKTVQQVLDDSAFAKTQLIIGHVTAAELRLLANAAKLREIPFVDVNFPNDGGITSNPQFVILNTTLRSHCEALYKFIQRNWATSNILYLRRSSSEDDRLRAYFAEIEKNTSSVPLRMKYVTVNDNLDLSRMLPAMDSNTKTIVLVGSLDENFGRAVCAKLSPLGKSYPIKILGMPTWDAINDFSAASYADLDIYYTTPFYMNPADSLVASIQLYYKTKFYSRPSDMVYRGFETILHFGQLLEANNGKVDGSIGEKKFRVFNDFDIQPVFTGKDSSAGATSTLSLQYLENKKLYYIKKVNGNVVAVY